MLIIECDFERTGESTVKCRRCDRELPGTEGLDPSTIHAMCRVRCRHLGESTGNVKTGCTSCNGRFLFVRSHACELHGRCLPTFRPRGEALEEWRKREPEQSLYPLCSGCEDFAPSVSQPTTHCPT